MGFNSGFKGLILISNFRPILNVVFFLLGDPPKERTEHTCLRVLTYLLPP